MNPYIGHPSQVRGVEEHRLVGGKGDGMRLLQVRSGAGLEFTVSADRCGDLARLSYRGYNFGYFAPCGYVAPSHYDRDGAGFLKSFTAGFLTTCGLYAVGSPCEDEGERLPMHGSIGNTPAESLLWEDSQEEISIRAKVRDAALFGHQMLLSRTYRCRGNQLILEDEAENIGPRREPYMILYHFNIGYPLLDETSRLHIPAVSTVARDPRAQEGIAVWNKVEPPQRGFQEQCYYHTLEGKPTVAIFNEKIGLGLAMQFDTAQLSCFTQWKQMGEYEYVLGLEPGNCNPDGRDIVRKKGALCYLEPGRKAQQRIQLTMLDTREQFEKILKGDNG